MNPGSQPPDRESQVTRRMRALGVRETDLAETFVCSGGPGGQNVNKTATCVLLVHRPTGIQVKCQAARQQGTNRFLARVWLLDKLESLRQARQAAERAAREKARRRNRLRSPAAKHRMLEDKARQARRKAYRRRVAEEEK